MHLKNLIKSKRESRKKNVEKMMKKLHKHKSFFSYKELLFNLGNYVWDEKWPSFITLSLIEKLSIITPFEPDNFSFNNPTKDHPLYWGAKKKDFLRSLNNQMPDVGRQIWKIRVSKDVELTP